MLNIDDSFDFFKQVVDKKDDYLDLEEDYRDIHEFFSNQIHTWQQLQQALRVFDRNRQALEKDADAGKALAELHTIESADAPYGMLHKVASLVSDVEAVNERLLTEKRNLAVAQVDDKIKQLESEMSNSGIASPELSNRLLRPVQLVKATLENETSISGIYMLQTETVSEHFDDGLHELERAVQAEIERREKTEQVTKAAKDDPAVAGTSTPAPAIQPEPPVSKPKPVVEVDVGSIYNKTCKGFYLESQDDIDGFVEALRSELEAVVQQDKRVRLR